MPHDPNVDLGQLYSATFGGWRHSIALALAAVQNIGVEIIKVVIGAAVGTALTIGIGMLTIIPAMRADVDRISRRVQRIEQIDDSASAERKLNALRLEKQAGDDRVVLEKLASLDIQLKELRAELKDLAMELRSDDRAWTQSDKIVRRRAKNRGIDGTSPYEDLR